MNSLNSPVTDPSYCMYLKDLHESYAHRLGPRVIGAIFTNPSEQTYEFELGIGGVYDFQICIASTPTTTGQCTPHDPRRIELSFRVNSVMSDFVARTLDGIMSRFTKEDLTWEDEDIDMGGVSNIEAPDGSDIANTDSETMDFYFAFQTLPANHLILTTVIVKLAESLMRKWFSIEGRVGFLKTESNHHGRMNTLGISDPEDTPIGRSDAEIDIYVARATRYRETHPHIDAILRDLSRQKELSPDTRWDLIAAGEAQFIKYQRGILVSEKVQARRDKKLYKHIIQETLGPPPGESSRPDSPISNGLLGTLHVWKKSADPGEPESA